VAMYLPMFKVMDHLG